MLRGTVKWFDQAKGFGFLTGDDGDEVFVHASALPDGVDTLTPGQPVEFSVTATARSAKARHVTLLPQGRTAPVGLRADELAMMAQYLNLGLGRHRTLPAPRPPPGPGRS
ncbi:cold-shock protein [Streptomyces sp. NPDC003480]